MIIEGSRKIHIIDNMKLAILFGCAILSFGIVTSENVCNGIWCTPLPDTTECKGSIVFEKDGVEQTVSTEDTSNLPSFILFDSLRVDGCPCWIIYKLKNLRPKKKLWQGNTYTRDELRFGKLRSLQAVKCESIASGTWIVVVVVAVVALFAVLAAVVGVKCYKKRKYSQPSQESA